MNDAKPDTETVEEDAPDIATPADPGDDVDRQARRRRMIAIVASAAAVILVAALAIGLPKVFGSTGDDSTEAASGGSDKAAAAQCPSDPKDLSKPLTPAESGKAVPWVTEGATVATFCTAALDDTGLPAEKVTTTVVDDKAKVQTIIESVNTMPAPRGAVCPMIAGTPYRIVLSYPDGRETTLDADTSGCGVITDGTAQRIGSRKLLGDIRDKADVKLDVPAGPGGGKVPQ